MLHDDAGGGGGGGESIAERLTLCNDARARARISSYIRKAKQRAGDYGAHVIS